MIADLLDVARIDQGLFRMELEPLNVAAMMDDIARSLSTPNHEIHVHASSDAVVLEDYNKGVLVPSVIRAALDAAAEAGIPSVVDPKFRNFMAFEGATYVAPRCRAAR